MANIQGVETPWKSQLTDLQAQDTTISSLGTLFSKLSNDMSSLTDLTGILAQKTGSSSNNNELTPTSADATAVAGTHTVTITNLAQTSSGSLAPIVNGKAALAGSITLAVGGGASQTITLSSNNTLAGLAAAINASGVGITASVLTDSNVSRLNLVSGTSGAAGQISVLANTISAATDPSLSFKNATTSSSQYPKGSLTSVAKAADVLTGNLSIQVGTGTTQNIVIGAAPTTPAANTIYTGSGVNTLAGLASAITGAGIGVTAAVVNNTDGSATLSITSGTLGSSGSLTVGSSLADTSTSLGYSSSVAGKDAALNIDGVDLTSSTNTVVGLIPGVTFQLLAPSTKESDGTLESIQVVIGNDNTAVESTVNTMVSDYNSLISSVNTQQGDNTSGVPLPLFGSPTLTLLQQQLLGGLNKSNPNGYMAPITNGLNTVLSGSMTLSVGGARTATFVVGKGTNTASTFYTGSGVNTLAGLEAAINTANTPATLTYTGTTGSSTVTSTGTLGSALNSSSLLTGDFVLQVGNGTATDIAIGVKPSKNAIAGATYTGSGVNTLSTLATYINSNSSLGVTASVVTASDGSASLSLLSGTAGSAGTIHVTPSLKAAGLGVTASVITTGGQSTLSLLSKTAGTNGAVAINSSILATSDTALTFTDQETTTATTADSAVLDSVTSTDTISGSVTIQVGNKAAQTVTINSSDNTMMGLESAINHANLGVTASISMVNNQNTLTLTSDTVGSDGAMTITSNILNTTSKTSQTLDYTNSSDINNLSSLGISFNNDGTLTLNAASLDSVLNTDYSSVVGFFQNANSWGSTFTKMLTSTGSSSATGILALASKSNSSVESLLNANIAREDSLISVEQKSITAELTSANEIMQQIPTELASVNELYSAITGYNQNSNG